MSNYCYIVSCNEATEPTVFEELDHAKTSVKISYSRTDKVIEFKREGSDTYSIHIDGSLVGKIVESVIYSYPTHL